MLRTAILLCALGGLTACGDPLDGIDRISDVDLAEGASVTASALPTQAEVDREGFFGTDAARGGKNPAKNTAGGLLGLFGGGGSAVSTGDGPDARDVSFGTTLPYGTVARVCDAKGKSLGKAVEQAPARGYTLHDSTPGSATARTWYITGFSDGCPRQMTAANVVMGSASLYEQLHYGPGGENLTTGETDAAYERIKGKVCGVRQGKPCGRRIDRMDRDTFFVNAYDSFGNSSRWTELLIHGGTTVAAAVKTSG